MENKEPIEVENLYDYSKVLISNESPLDPVIFGREIKKVAEDMVVNHYLMLLCRERNDYTIFNISDKNNINSLTAELKETLNNRGHVLVMDKQDTGAWEIWIRDFATEENFAYYLFDYTPAVIEV